IKDRNYVIIGAVLVFRDITEKNKLLEISQRNQKLESLGILAGGIAHDFNNLMGGIFGNIDLALHESKECKVTQFLSLAMNTIDRARGLTQQLLTFAKGGAPVQKPAYLFPLIQEIAQFTLSGSSVSCQYDIAPDLWPCSIDKDQIGQVVSNIIINAQQAMPSGGGIEITAANVSMGEKEHESLQKGEYVKVTIRDHGVGISKKILPHIFDPFFTTKMMGHGLGLSTCHSIINRHGGAIDVESKMDEGSTFCFYLPAASKPVVSKPVSDVRHMGSGRIIIMDDEEIIRGTLRNMLESLGYSVICTNNGWEAVEFYAKETKSNRQIAAVFFDLTVRNGMDGKVAVKEIRKLNSKIPVFVASGYANDPVMKNPVEYGFSASIGKPFRMMELAEILEKHVKENSEKSGTNRNGI
ncbi:MAG: response regulator, partial [Spirochaetaceae bacterium]